MTIDDIISELLQHHFPNHPPDAESIRDLVDRVPGGLPDELLAIWRKMDGVRLFHEEDYVFRILRVNEVCSADQAMRKESELGWFIFCDILDGNYLAWDSTPNETGMHDVRDVFHEMFPDVRYCQVVENSVTKFLSNAISFGNHYWLAR